MSEESGSKPELRSRRITVMGRRRSRAHEEDSSETEARDTDPLPPPPDDAGEAEETRQTFPRDPKPPSEAQASGERISEPEDMSRTNPRIVIDVTADGAQGLDDEEEDDDDGSRTAQAVVVMAPARIISDAPPADEDEVADVRVELAVSVDEAQAAAPDAAAPVEEEDEPEIEVATIPGTASAPPVAEPDLAATHSIAVSAAMAAPTTATVAVPPRTSGAPPPVPVAALEAGARASAVPLSPSVPATPSRPPPPPPAAQRDATPPADQWLDFEDEEEHAVAESADADMAALEASDSEKADGTSSEAPRRRTPPPPPNELAGLRASIPNTSPSPRKPPPPPAPPPAKASTEDDKGKRKRTRQWWERFFSDDYLLTVLPPTQAQISRQVDFIEQSLGLPKGAMILDVGCGLGLHAVELTRRGYLVVGLDLSLPMITRAAETAQEQGLKINFLHADIREIAFDGAFDAVICMGTTFGFFDDDSNRDVLHRLYQALRPGGRILLDVVNRDYVLRWQPNLVWFEGDGCVCMEESDFNYFNSRLVVKRTVMHEDGHQTQSEYSLRVYSLHELGLLTQQLGFRVIEVSGQEATRGVFFGAVSGRILMLAERRLQGRASVVMPERVTGEVPRPPAPSSGNGNGSGNGEPPKPPPPSKS